MGGKKPNVSAGAELLLLTVFIFLVGVIINICEEDKVKPAKIFYPKQFQLGRQEKKYFLKCLRVEINQPACLKDTHLFYKNRLLLNQTLTRVQRLELINKCYHRNICL